MSNQFHTMIKGRVGYYCTCGFWARRAEERDRHLDCVPAICSASVVEAVKVWRKAEKRHAAIVLGIIEGDKAEAKDIADRKLHAVRIEAEKLELMQNDGIEACGVDTPHRKTK